MKAFTLGEMVVVGFGLAVFTFFIWIIWMSDAAHPERRPRWLNFDTKNDDPSG